MVLTLIKKDNRLRCVIVHPDGHKQTISYPKYLMEVKLNRYLSTDEQIDHIDGNPQNNDYSNLQILYLGKHQELDALRNKDITINCAYCGKEFTIKGNIISQRNRHGSGYFCSKKCSGKYGKEIQSKTIIDNKADKVTVEKYKEKSAQLEITEVEAG